MATAKEEGNTTSNAQVLYVIGFQAPLMARFSTRSAKIVGCNYTKNRTVYLFA